MFNQINSLYMTGNYKKIKEELLPKIQDFKKETEKQDKTLEIKNLLKKVELIETIFEKEPEKLEGFLIFADILGWKGIWKKQDKKDIANVTFFIKNILEKEFDKELEEKKYNISLISDTFIVFSKELELSNNLSKKLIELCLENDLVIRGAISYGECYNKDTVYVGPAVDEAASWHDEGEEIGIFCTPSAKKEIINNKYDLAIIPHRFIRSILLARMAGIKKLVGFDVATGSFLLKLKLRNEEETGRQSNSRACKAIQRRRSFLSI